MGEPAAGTPTSRRTALGLRLALAFIPADELPRVFDRFWRGRQAAQTSGSGIGLAMAAALTRAHGGHLSAVSQPGHGTRLTLTLPRT